MSVEQQQAQTTEQDTARGEGRSDPWRLTQRAFDAGRAARDETLFALGNGYIGLRSLEELMKDDVVTERAPGAEYGRSGQKFTNFSFATKEYGHEEVVDDREARLVARLEKAKEKFLAREGKRFEKEFWRKERMKEKARIRRKRERTRAKKAVVAPAAA